jgi:hypothetical protein
MVLTDAPVSTDVAHLDAVGGLEWWQLVGHFPWGGFIAGGGGVHAECLVRTLMIELFTAVVEPVAGGREDVPQAVGWCRLSACEACAHGGHSVAVCQVQ